MAYNISFIELFRS